MNNRRSTSKGAPHPLSLGAATIAAGLTLCPEVSRADEVGISFWLPGQYASLAATPTTPGWAVAAIYYHTNVAASGATAAAREFQIGRFSPNVNINLNVSLTGQADLMVLAPTYTFATPVFGGQLSASLAGIYGRSAASIAGTLTVSAGSLVAMRSGMLEDALTSYGDLFPTVKLAWNSGVNNFMVYVAGDVPVGDYNPSRLANTGLGHGAVDVGGGYTYFNPMTGNEFSGVAGFTYNSKNQDTQYQSGIDFHFDWGASHFLSKQVFVGLAGYAYQQITDDFGQPAILDGNRSRVLGIGPQIGYIFPVGGLQGFLGARAYGEFDAANRPPGWNTWLTFAISEAALSRRNILLGTSTLVAAATLTSGALAQAQKAAPAVPAAAASGRKPNILVIWGDDIGQSNISAYTFGLMGYKTPNIDRIAREGMTFTDYYAENSCTAGRSSFITGQAVYRTGMSKVGIPGAPVGLQARDITLAEALKPLGYATGQFGKNHLGDRNEYLPTVHGFDEFFGNLYHLNAEEEPERPNYPKNDAEWVKFNSPRGVRKCKATDRDDPTTHERWGRVGKQTIEDTGALSRKRMETIDDETSDAAIDFIKRQTAANKPFFCWFNATRMHLFTHVRQSMRGQSGMPDNEYADGMIEHDGDVGKLLKTVDDLNIANDTIVIYSTDNGPNMFSWPDAAMTPFRSEKDTNWEGAFRVPCMIRWPGHIKPGEISNELVSGLDWFPTLMAAAGDPGVKEKLLTGYDAVGKTFKVHLDGFNQLPYLTGQQPKSPRTEYYYFNDDGDLVAMRMGDWKLVFSEQRAPGNMLIWANPFTKLRVPKLFNLRQDPYERADITSYEYYRWTAQNPPIINEGVFKAAKFLDTFVAYPPSQKAPSFSVDQIMEDVKEKIAKMKT